MTMPAKPTAAGILQAGIDHLAERAVTYDKPQGERSVGKVIAMFNELIAEKLKVPLSEEDGWNFMELLKLVRSKQGAYKSDSFEDRACYAALAAEAAFRDRVALPMIGECMGGDREHKLAPDLGPVEGKPRQAPAGPAYTLEARRCMVCHGEHGGGMSCPSMRPMSTLRELAGADLRFDQTGRQDAVDQNGNTGEHYTMTLGEDGMPCSAK